jgi:amidase
MPVMTTVSSQVRQFVYQLSVSRYNARQVKKQTAACKTATQRPLDFSPFIAALATLTDERAQALDERLIDATIPDIQRWLAGGELTSVELTLYYLFRIKRFDVGRLNSVIELNPDALSIAEALDQERRAGKLRGALHGIPVLLKDNIGTGDRLHTTAGALALIDAHADRDAFLVGRLRDAGTIVLGKTNLSEWANYMSDHSVNGFSAVGGQTHNPHGPFDVSGSSSGSAVAVSERFATLAVGTETYGSIISPAGQNAVVGLKPSLGLISRDRIVPITDATDTAGPMASNVTDLSLLLSALAGPDPNDPMSHAAYATEGLEITPSALADRLDGLCIGWLQPEMQRAGDKRVYARAIEALQHTGATVVKVPFAPPKIAFDLLLRFGFKAGVNAYLAATQAPIASLADIVSFNQQDLRQRAPYGQRLLEKALQETISCVDYKKLVQQNRTAALAAVHKTLADNHLDALLTFDAFSTFGGVFPMAGVPTLSVPAGRRASGEPVGMVLAGDYLQDKKLIAIAFAFEQATKHRKASKS